MIYYNYDVAICVLCFFLMMLWVGLQSVIMAFPCHTHTYFVLFNRLKGMISCLHISFILHGLKEK